nr:hypothetical protein [Tanacetum cinerariifolium]
MITHSFSSTSSYLLLGRAAGCRATYYGCSHGGCILFVQLLAYLSLLYDDDDVDTSFHSASQWIGVSLNEHKIVDCGLAICFVPQSSNSSLSSQKLAFKIATKIIKIYEHVMFEGMVDEHVLFLVSAIDSVKDMTTKFGKLDKFEGSDFRRWQKKMHFLLTTLKVVYVQSTPAPAMEESGKGKGKEIARSSSVNMVEDDKNKKNNKNSKGNIRKFHDKKNNSNKKPKMVRWKCRKPGHFKKDFRVKKNNGDDEIAWWIDSGATCHACKNHCWFDTFHPVEDGSVLHMGDESTKPILGRGNVVIEFSSGKTITLFNVVVPNKNNKNTPYELWNKKQPNLSYLRGWGCRAAVRLPEPKKKNLGEKGIDCIFIGYVEHSKTYRFYFIEPNDFISVNSVIESRHAIFDENKFSSVPRPKYIIFSSNGTQGGDLPVETLIEILEPQRSNRARKEAVDDEIGSIMINNTWVLSDLPPGCKPLGCKWIFKKKMKVDGTIDKFKARLIVDSFGSYLQSSDPSNGCQYSFLNGDLEKEIYMKQPEGFVMPGCGPVSTPMKACIKLMPHMGTPVNQLEYSRAIGCLMYAMTITRSDIAYDVRKLSRFTSNPSNHHWEAIIRVFSEDHTSTTGWVFLLGEGAISWASKKQTCITDLTMESEFVALAVARKEFQKQIDVITKAMSSDDRYSHLFTQLQSQHESGSGAAGDDESGDVKDVDEDEEDAYS